ncbi:MAG: Asp-tRNA(Asn)/Glu-tRNA(Gln) amidotransferase subunit GatB [Candidatus Nanohaloarchaea archaeon]
MVMIGLETHVQLDTKSKLFCGCRNSKDEEPNENVCETCLGMPGSKPRINGKVLKQALKTSLALECDVNEDYFFSRKTYFYPDMSKNYQITQFELPVGEKGEFEVKVEDDKINVGITRLHIEEDPAKLVHEGGSVKKSDYTKVDYNRAGTPLLEIVTDPDFETPEQARAYLQQLSQMLEYLGIYDPESDFAIKSDANISIEGGERIEVKNITGTSDIEKALNYEISRQKQMKKRGKEITQETRGFNPGMGSTEKMREKETEEDYGYIFDPDLTRQRNNDNKIKQASKEIPELPKEKLERYMSKGLKPKMAEALVSDPEIADLFEMLESDFDSVMTASLLTGDLKKVLNYHEIRFSESGLKKKWFKHLLKLVEEEKISDRNAEEALREAVDNPRPFKKIVEDEDLLKSGEDETAQVVEQVIEEEDDAVEDYHDGDEGALNYLVGQVMSTSGGKADPKNARELLKEQLEN